MDVDDFRSVLENCRVDLWNFIDTAITVASLDYGIELKHRRDGIVERLYAATSCTNCDVGRIKAALPKGKRAEEDSPSTPQSVDLEGLFVDDEQKRILDIKESLEDPHLPEDSVVDLLQSLADMDITFKALKETDIGRHVNLLRKHSSSDVRRLVKQLVRKWKETVDNWVRLNQRGELAASSTIMDGDSPQQKTSQNEHSQVPDFASSPNPLNGSSGSEKNNSEPEPPKPKPMPQKKTSPKLAQSVAMSASSQNRQREHKKERESTFESERLASARKRLQDNYKEAENAKKQRTIQVMGIHEIPKPKNAFFGKNKGGGSQGRHW